MSPLEIHELFDEGRLTVGWSTMTLFVYFPFGLVLATVRLFIGFQAYLAASLLPQLTFIRSFVLRSMSLVLGIVVQQENLGNRDKSVKVIVANCLTPIDHLALHLVEGTVTPNSWDLPSSLGEAIGVIDLGVKQGRESLIQNAARYLMKSSAAPLFAQPEGVSTNGKKGLLKFSTWPFSLESACTSVQPVALSVWRPGVIDLTISPLASRPWMDIFWFLFVPFTMFTVRYLPCVQKKEDESTEEFTDRVQGLLAADLNVVPTKYTAADKAEHEKRYLLELSRASMASPPTTLTASQTNNSRNRFRAPMSQAASIEIQRMARQVKEVLPHVPLDAITRDLVRTRSVDLTIANILEGQVAFQPEPTPPVVPSPVVKLVTQFSPTCSATTSPSTSPMASSLDTSAPSFPKTANERMLSFQQRKDRLIENARRKYIEKNGLKIAGFNC